MMTFGEHLYYTHGHESQIGKEPKYEKILRVIPLRHRRSLLFGGRAGVYGGCQPFRRRGEPKAVRVDDGGDQS